MIEKNNTQKILELFFLYPTTELHLREISRLVKVSMPTVITAIKKLEKEKLIEVKKGRVWTGVKANTENTWFIRKKRIYNIESLYLSGFVDFLIKEFDKPDTIVCFGSYSKGEDYEKSDIDIALLNSYTFKSFTYSKRKTHESELEKFEKILCRKISIHHIQVIGTPFTKEFQSNLQNGIVLDGAL